MATFLPGQRVKIVCDMKPEHLKTAERLVGSTDCRTGVLLYALDFWQSMLNNDCDWFMRDDLGNEGCVHQYRLEIIQPERNRIVAWESLPIDPRKIGEEIA